MKKLNLIGLVAIGLIGCCSVVRADGVVTPPEGKNAQTQPYRGNGSFIVIGSKAQIASDWLTVDRYGTAATIALSDYGSDAQKEQYKAELKSDLPAFDRLTSAYVSNLSDGQFSNYALSDFLYKYEVSRGGLNSAIQEVQIATENQVKFSFLIASQNSVLIQQNKQIISLLTKIANKK